MSENGHQPDPEPGAGTGTAPGADGSAGTQIVDAWMQHPTPRFFEASFFDSLFRWMGGKPPTDDLPISMTVAAMDEAGISKATLSAWHSPRYGAMISNDDVAGWVAEHPDRFVGLAAVDLANPVAAVRELRRRVTEDGFRGLRILPWLWEVPPTDRRFYPLYAECVELGVPVCTQVGHTGPLMPSDVGRPIPWIDQVAIDFPELAIVCGHIGYPWTEEMIAVARKHDNVVIDTSAYTAKRYPANLVEWMKSKGGRERVLFGSNWPMISPSKALAELDSLGLDAECRAAFLGGNAARVFRLA